MRVQHCDGLRLNRDVLREAHIGELQSLLAVVSVIRLDDQPDPRRDCITRGE